MQQTLIFSTHKIGYLRSMKRLMRILLICLFVLVVGLTMHWYLDGVFSSQKQLSVDSSSYFHTDPVLFFVMKILFLK